MSTTTESYETPFERFNVNNNIAANENDNEKAYQPLDTKTIIVYGISGIFISYMLYLLINLFITAFKLNQQ
jgi:hypothetical protein